MNKLEEEKEKFWNKMNELEEFSNQQREENEKLQNRLGKVEEDKDELWSKMRELEKKLSGALDQIKKAKTSSGCFGGICGR